MLVAGGDELSGRLHVLGYDDEGNEVGESEGVCGEQTMLLETAGFLPLKDAVEELDLN